MFHQRHVITLLCSKASLYSPVFVRGGSSPEDLLREYRRLDDTITMRLNRTNAQFRDRDRQHAGGKGSIQDQACVYVWLELLGKLPELVLPQLWLE